MDMHEHDHRDHPDRQDCNSRSKRLVFWGFLLVVGYFLLTEHLAHVMTALPYLLLAACPLMHFFHHGGHKHSGKHGLVEQPLEKSASQPPCEPDPR